KALEKDRNDRGAVLGLARVLIEQRNDGPATKLLEQLRADDPADYLARYILTGVHLRNGRLDLGEQVAREAEELQPKSVATRRLLARLHNARGRKKQALVLLSELARELPQATDIRFELAKSLLQAGEIDVARGHVDSLATLAPGAMQLTVLRCVIALIDKDFDTAHQLADHVMAVDEHRPVGLKLRGDAYFAAGKHADAVLAYDESMSLAPSRSVLKLSVQAERASGESQRGKFWLSKWLLEHPDDTEVRLWRGMVLEAEGKVDDARAEYRRVLERDKNNLGALNNLAWLTGANDPDAGLVLAQRALQVAPDNPTVLDTYGWLLLKIGQGERGLSYLTRAADGSPDNHDIRYHLARALFQVGRVDEARIAIERVGPNRDALKDRAGFDALVSKLNASGRS
ncbi:MAG: tetratricopeptide repeat protein, partial [Gammaproteobacteria bacterium]|nr:tetratricopeptide repeat protein [Gammaproteobacteria bacterium]